MLISQIFSCKIKSCHTFVTEFCVELYKSVIFLSWNEIEIEIECKDRWIKVGISETRFNFLFFSFVFLTIITNKFYASSLVLAFFSSITACLFHKSFFLNNCMLISQIFFCNVKVVILCHYFTLFFVSMFFWRRNLIFQ